MFPVLYITEKTECIFIVIIAAILIIDLVNGSYIAICNTQEINIAFIFTLNESIDRLSYFRLTYLKPGFDYIQSSNQSKSPLPPFKIVY
jgi:hypothetical protein